MKKAIKSAIIYLVYTVFLILTTLFELLNIENGLAGIFILVASVFAVIFSLNFIRIGFGLLSLIIRNIDDDKIEYEAQLIKKSGSVMFIITTVWFGLNILGIVLHTIAYLFS